jgi:hypothetical protein
MEWLCMNNGKIIWYLATPRELPGKATGIREFSYKKTRAPSRHDPRSMVVAWDVYYRKSFVIQMGTIREVKQFITEKLDT